MGLAAKVPPMQFKKDNRKKRKPPEDKSPVGSIRKALDDLDEIAEVAHSIVLQASSLRRRLIESIPDEADDIPF